jgi:catechol 2,3-dioxygenase-like lactoylglutathione lyase family enzyme
MAKPRLTHVAFNCEDVDGMVEFYREFAELDTGLDRMDGDTRVAWLNAGDGDNPFLLVLIGRPGLQPDEPHAVEHLGFECGSRDEVDEIISRAHSRGVPVLEGPLELPPPVGYLVILGDPAGNRVEFACPTPTR